MWSILTNPWIFVPGLLLLGAIAWGFREVLFDVVMLVIAIPAITVWGLSVDLCRKLFRRQQRQPDDWIEGSQPIIVYREAANLIGSPYTIFHVTLDQSTHGLLAHRLTRLLEQYEGELTALLTAERARRDTQSRQPDEPRERAIDLR